MANNDAMYTRLLESVGLQDITRQLTSLPSVQPSSSSEFRIVSQLFPGQSLQACRSDMVRHLLDTEITLQQAKSKLWEAEVKTMKLLRIIDPSLSPISRLPEEILLLIFEHGVADEISYLRSVREARSPVQSLKINPLSLVDEPTHLSRQSFAMTVSHVCHLWKALARARSSLWVRVRPDWPLQLIQEHLTLSQDRGLHIDAVETRSTTKFDTVELCRTACQRWQGIYVSCDGIKSESLLVSLLLSTLLPPLSAADDGKSSVTPELRTLRIFNNSWGVNPLLESFTNAPKLEDLALQGVALDSIDEIAPSLVRTQLDLSGLFSWNWLGLGLAHNLQELTLRSNSGSQDQENETEDSTQTFILPQLHYLCIDVTPPGVLRDFLQLCRAPALHALSVNLEGFRRYNHDAVKNFVMASPALKVFEVYGDLREQTDLFEEAFAAQGAFEKLILGIPPFMSVDHWDARFLRTFLEGDRAPKSLEVDKRIVEGFEKNGTWDKAWLMPSNAAFYGSDDDGDYMDSEEAETLTEGFALSSEADEEEDQNAAEEVNDDDSEEEVEEEGVEDDIDDEDVSDLDDGSSDQSGSSSAEEPISSQTTSQSDGAQARKAKSKAPRFSHWLSERPYPVVVIDKYDWKARNP